MSASNGDALIERWCGSYDLRDRLEEHLDKLRIGDMTRLSKYNTFARARVTIVGVGHRCKLLRRLDWLAHVPVLCEVFHSYVVVDFER